MKFFRYTLGISLLALFSVSLNAQAFEEQKREYNDSYRSRGVWSLYGGVGIGGFTTLRNLDISKVVNYPTPEVYVGGSYYFFPYLRTGGSIAFHNIQSYATAQNYGSFDQPNFMVEGKPATLTTKWATLSDVNNMPTFSIVADAEFNPLNFWMADRKFQQLNLWIGTGLGYMHGCNFWCSSTAYKEQAVAKGEDYFNVYEHSYLTTESKETRTNQMVIPFKAAVEYDIFPNLTVGVQGQFCVFPLNVKYTPVGIGTASVSVRYNFLGKHYKSYKTRYYEDEKVIAELRNRLSELEAREPEIREVEKIVYKEVVKEVITSDNYIAVYFNLYSSGLSSQAKSAIRELAAKLKENPDLKLKAMVASANTIGGTEKSNMKISERRMSEVVKYLKECGVKEESINSAERKCVGSDGMSSDTYCCRVIIITE